MSDWPPLAERPQGAGTGRARMRNLRLGFLVCGRYDRVSPAIATSATGPTMGATDRQAIGDILDSMRLQQAERDS
jgi:hypothetical protein